MSEPTCEQRIDAYMASRLETIANLQSHNAKAAEEYGLDQGSRDFEDSCDDILLEMPLSIETFKVYKITLGTGGPGDWFEVRISHDGDPAEKFRIWSIDRIDYHFNDWFDHAQRTLDPNSEEYKTAEAFVSRFIEEMY